MSTELDRARAIAKIAHAGQEYSDGEPYFEAHIERVVEEVLGMTDATIGDAVTAYLHDVVEDTEVTLEDLATLGISGPVIQAVEVLTRVNGELYSEYIGRVERSVLAFARRVKIADIRVNLAASVRAGNDSLAWRYRKALARLEG